MTDDDAEVRALTEFQAQSTRWRKAIGIPFIAIGLGLAVGAYFLVQKWLIDAGWPSDGPIAMVLKGFGCSIPFAGSIALGLWLSRAVTNARRDVWLAELAAKHGVPLDALMESAQIFD